MAVYDVVERHISGAFVKYGKFLARYPIPILAAALLATTALGFGIFYLESEKDLEYLYTPENSRAIKDRHTVMQSFPDRSSDEFYEHQLPTLGLYGDIIVVGGNEGEHVLSEGVLADISIIDDFVKNITITINDTEYGYLNVCAKRSGECVSSGIQNLLNGSHLDASLTFPSVNVGDEIVDLPVIMGGIRVANNSVVQSAEAFRLRYYLQTVNGTMEISLAWERAFLRKMSQLKGNFTAAYSVSQSLNYELNEGTDGDVTYFSTTFTIMMIYAAVVCGTGSCLTARGFLANVGVYSAGLGILASFGFCSYIGVKLVNIVGVMPFLIIGIGIDDMFLLMSGWLQTSPSDTVEGRVSSAFGIVAVSITVTSLTDLLAFCIGATNIFPSLRNFCIYTGFAIIWCYLMQLTVFGSAMVFHTRRVQSSRHCFTCTKIPSEEQVNSGGKLWRCLCVCFCLGRKYNRKYDQEDKSIFERIPLHISSVILLKPMKVIILLMFAGYLAISIWGVINLEQGLLLNNLVPRESYLYSYLRFEREHFGAYGPVLQVVIDEPQGYWEENTRKNIDSLLDSLQENEYVGNDFSISWLDSFSTFHNGSLPTTQTTFVQSLQNDFLPMNPHFSGDLNISESGIIQASRYYVRSVGVNNSYHQGQMMVNVRKITDTSDLPVFVYTGAFVFFEQFVQVLPSTLQTVGVAVAAIFVVCIFFIPHPLCVIYVTLTMVMILVGLFGFMHFWGLSLSSITMIHVVMSVGFSVDFSAHICHAFMKADGMNRNDRVEVALSRVAAPIMNGGISSLLGIIILVNSSSYVFLSFFRIMLMTILFGMAHALLFLPVLLSLMGPDKQQPKGLEPKVDKLTISPVLNIERGESMKRQLKYIVTKVSVKCGPDSQCDPPHKEDDVVYCY